MLKLLKKLLPRRHKDKPPRMPFQFDEIEPWNNGDAASLSQFLSQPTGTKLMNTLLVKASNTMMRPGDISHREKGVVDGINEVVSDILIKARIVPSDNNDAWDR